MSDCPTQPQIEAYHDGELSPEVAAQVQMHLIECASCRAELRHLQAMTQFVQSFAPVELSNAAMGRLHEQVEDLTQRDTLRFAKQLSSLAACLLAAAGVWFATTTQSTDAAPAPWERAAVTLQVEPVSTTGTTMETDTAQWMLTSLSRSEQGD